MKQRRFDIPFGSDIWISIVLGLMLFVTSLSLLVSVGVNQYIQDWNSAVQATFTVELPHNSGTQLPDVVHMLKQHPDIERIEILEKSYVQKMMFQMVEIVSFSFGMIMIGAMCAIIAFIMYAEVQTHERTIELFNLLGAPNYFISKIFQKYAAVILIKSFVLSLALNFCLYIAIGAVCMEDGVYLRQELSWVTWTYVAFGIPALMMAIVQFIVPVTVLSCLKKKYRNSLYS